MIFEICGNIYLTTEKIKSSLGQVNNINMNDLFNIIKYNINIINQYIT